MGSDPSDACSHSSPEISSSPVHRASHSSEDLYTWMAKQDVEASNLEGKNVDIPLSLTKLSKTKFDMVFNQYLKNLICQFVFIGCLESKINTMQTDSSGEPGTIPRESLPVEVPVNPILDTNQIFQPLLCGLGIMPQQLRFTTMSDSSNNNDIFVIQTNLLTYFRYWK